MVHSVMVIHPHLADGRRAARGKRSGCPPGLRRRSCAPPARPFSP